MRLNSFQVVYFLFLFLYFIRVSFALNFACKVFLTECQLSENKTSSLLYLLAAIRGKFSVFKVFLDTIFILKVLYLINSIVYFN